MTQTTCPHCGTPRATTQPCSRCGYIPRRHLNTTQRGYGTSHQQQRRYLLANAYYTHCDICGEPMLPGQPLDLDHTTPLIINPNSIGDTIIHAHCNRGAASQRKNETTRSDPASPKLAKVGFSGFDGDGFFAA